jgi:protein Mpv17
MEDQLSSEDAKTSTEKIATTTTFSEEPPSTNNGQDNDMEDALQITQQNKEITKKILNGLLLAASFGYAAYTIFNIDAGMTRGWTQQEIAMRIPLDNWLNYESSLADRPIFTKTAINVIIYLLGDWLSQTVFKGQNILDFDAGRTLKNGFIGLCFGPLVHEYYQFSDYILPVEGGMWNRFEKILMDQTIYLIVKCSIYIAAVGFLAGETTETVKNNVQTKLPGIVVTAWKFWPLVHLGTWNGIARAKGRTLFSLLSISPHTLCSDLWIDPRSTSHFMGQLCGFSMECHSCQHVTEKRRAHQSHRCQRR